MSGWKDWQQLEVVNEIDFQNFIQDQVVQVYADATARNTALGVNVADGMVSYLKNTDSLEVYNGSAWVSASGTGASASGVTNWILNSDMNIWQRGNTVNYDGSAYQYSTDRWTIGRSSLDTSLSATKVEYSASVFPGFRYAARIRRTAGDTDTGTIYFCQNLEDFGFKAQGQTATLSFYLKKGSTYSGGDVNAVVTTTSSSWLSATRANGGLLNGLFDVISYGSTDVTPTTSWTRYSTTFTMGTNQNAAQVAFSWTPSGTAGADDDIFITGVQLEINSAATSFHTNQPNPQGELAACQRYYQQYDFSLAFNGSNVTGRQALVATKWKTTDAIIANMPLVTEMRTIPTFTRTLTTARYVNSGSGSTPTVSYFGSNATNNMVAIAYTNDSIAPGSGWIDNMGIYKFEAEL